MLVLGRIAVMLALVFSLAGVAFLALGLRHRSRELIRSGYFAAYGMFLSVAVACAVLLHAFIARDFSFQYVYENSAAGLSAFYRVAGFWAGQQGSFLLWLLLLSAVTAIIALRNVRDGDRLTGGAVMVLCIVGAAFATLMVFDPGSRPFTATPAGEVSPFGLNPLLLHPAMVLHPPALFLGYVGLTVPFAFAVSALLLGQSDRIWARLSQKWTVAGWLFLSLGIGLGAWWAYVVLSLGRLLGLGSRGEHVADPLAHGHGLAPLHEPVRQARHLPALDDRAGGRHLLAHHGRHLDDALRGHQLGARVREAADAGRHPVDLRHRRGAREHRSDRLALAPLSRRPSHRGLRLA